tara:strand:+ start:4891 stop:5304 length:414 start_codon:yes stop_codon:yes gene_type:complete
MKANLVFFGSKSDSKGGLQRSLVSFLVFLAASWVWFGTAVEKSNLITRLAASMSLALVLASALGVFLPDTSTSIYDVVLYSALVGAVISVSIASALVVWAGSSIGYAISMVAVFVAICALMGWANFKFFSKINFYNK